MESPKHQQQHRWLAQPHSPHNISNNNMQVVDAAAKFSQQQHIGGRRSRESPLNSNINTEVVDAAVESPNNSNNKHQLLPPQQQAGGNLYFRVLSG